jgi:hypothetical protein
MGLGRLGAEESGDGAVFRSGVGCLVHDSERSRGSRKPVCLRYSS